MDYNDLLKKLLEQETQLQFKSFSNEDAWRLGQLLVDKAKKENKVVTINITRNGHQLFHYALQGTSSDNDTWIQRKMRVVNHFNHSSHYMEMKLESQNKTIEGKYFLDGRLYAANGGSFPIIIKDTGVIGTITVSGLTADEDHQMIVDVLTIYLKG
jgi:uncharacterized protein (UPF0303 family)